MLSIERFFIPFLFIISPKPAFLLLIYCLFISYFIFYIFYLVFRAKPAIRSISSNHPAAFRILP